MDTGSANASNMAVQSDRNAWLLKLRSSMTLASAADNRAAPARGTGAVLIATAIAMLALFAFHPGGDAHGLAAVLKDEAAHRTQDAIVHGGFIAVLSIQSICYAIFSARPGLQRPAALAGLVFFAFGTAFLCGSLVVDGLVTPAVAARYADAPDKIEFARSLFVLMGALIGVLMPLGLAFQSAAVAAWGWALMAAGAARAAGISGVTLGVLLLLALGANVAIMNPVVLMIALAAMALWALIVGVALWRGNV